ncbi:MAG: hypothetical protein N3H30_01225 [Candidatus Micrarchaeota archaeon]|nr:hypothetical protein [Candidatus Micrarchaeota archaeon]
MQGEKDLWELAVDGNLMAICKYAEEHKDAESHLIAAAYICAINMLRYTGNMDALVEFGTIKRYSELSVYVRWELADAIGADPKNYLFLCAYLENEPDEKVRKRIEELLVECIPFVYAIPNRGPELAKSIFLINMRSERVRIAAIDFFATMGNAQPMRELLSMGEGAGISDKVKMHLELVLNNIRKSSLADANGVKSNLGVPATSRRCWRPKQLKR